MAQATAAAGKAITTVYKSSNVKHLCRMEIPGGSQIVFQGRYCFIGHQHGPDGTTILDVSDPRAPKVVCKLMVAHPQTHTHKVRVVGDLMVVNSEIEPGKGSRQGYEDGGFRIYDIKDKANPRLLSFTRTHARGVHRFDLDASYAYLSTEMPGFAGNILAIYDIRKPEKPVEVSRWWMPGQHTAAGEPANPKGGYHMLHHAMRSGNKLYAGCWGSGVAIIDVTDIEKPRTLSHLDYNPIEPTHTFLEVPFAIAGKTIAVSTEEERPKRGPDTGKPHAALRTWDVSDPAQPRLLAKFEIDEKTQPYHGDDVRFGTHQLREAVDKDCLLFVTWFAAGLRIVDISDPARPRERGHIIPKPADGHAVPWTNDVARDERGLVFFTDKVFGLDVIEFEG